MVSWVLRCFCCGRNTMKYMMAPMATYIMMMTISGLPCGICEYGGSKREERVIRSLEDVGGRGLARATEISREPRGAPAVERPRRNLLAGGAHQPDQEMYIVEGQEA